jgi:heptosyltransferase-1
MRILVVKTTSMGDIVHTLPAVSDMAQAFPQVQIDWLIEQPFAAIARLHPSVHRVIPIQFRKWRKRFWAEDVRSVIKVRLDELRAEPYDWIIDFQGLVKSALFARSVKGKSDAVIAGYDRASIKEPLAACFYDQKARVSRHLPAVERNRGLAAQHLGYSVGNQANFGIAATLDHQLHPWCPKSAYVVLMPAASRVEKLWSEDYWVAVAERFKVEGLAIVVLWGSKEEHARAERLAQRCTGIVPPFLTVVEAAGLLAGSHMVIGLDTGFTHLASALGRPTIGIYCDHEPGLAPVTGPAFTASLGGKKTAPTKTQVLDSIEIALKDLTR